MTKGTSGRGDNITEIDFTEKVHSLLQSNGLGKKGKYKPGSKGYRPGMYGNGSRPGNKSSWDLGRAIGLPAEMKPKAVLGGGFTGVALNRLFYRLTPMVIPTDKKLLVDGVNMLIGLIPYVVKQTSFTAGVALPGMYFAGGDVADMLLDFVPGLRRPALSSPRIASAKKEIKGSEKTSDRLKDASKKIEGAQRTLRRKPIATGRVH